MSTNDFKVPGGYSALFACGTSYKMTNTVVPFMYSHIVRFYQNGTYTQARVVKNFSVTIGQPLITQKFDPFYFVLCIISISKISRISIHI